MSTNLKKLNEDERKLIENALIKLCAKGLKHNFKGKVKSALKNLNVERLRDGDTLTVNFPVKISWSFIEYLLSENRRDKKPCQVK
jgi:hypothetical protein